MVDWGRVEVVFSEAVELEGDARAAYLDRECEGDTQLKREVERLLRSLESAGTFLAKPLLRVDTEVLSPGEAVPLQRLGQLVGDYKLVDVLGRGGMGVVYLATREGEFERKVALKLIEGWAPPALIERFERERQVLAGLEHPYIARMYEGGTTEDNQPYLVMEYVDGLPLEQYCEVNRLSVSERLRLFLKVCAGVAYAHRNLLVHRDLKPSNILVTAEGVPKLLDFGIAKSLDPEAGAGMTTTQGPSPMTLAYASPEQVRGETISTASDVYSLGVVLFKLMAGRFPYSEMEDSFELGKEIVDGEVLRPSTSVSAGGGHELKGDIDAIVLRALRKDPDDRYPSVEALSKDIERHLGNLPVLAREGDLRDRVQKFVRRNRWGLMAAITAMAVIAVFTIAQMRASTIAKREQDRAEQALEVLLEAFKVSDPEISRGRVVTAREILDGGAEAVRKGAQDPELQATLFGAIGDVYVSLAEFDQAEQLHLEALELRKVAKVDVGLSLYQLGEGAFWRRDYGDAERYYREALTWPTSLVTRARILRGLGHALVWEGREEEAVNLLTESREVLAAELGEGSDEVLWCVEGLARAARNLGQYDRASKLFEELVEARRPGGEGPALGRSLAELGDVRRLQGRFEEARALLEEALPMLRASMGARNPYVGEMLGKLVPVHWRLGDLEDAETAIDEVLKILPENHPGTATALHNLALIQTDRGDLVEAEKVAREALERQRSLFGEEHENVAASLCGLGRIAIKRGAFETARKEFQACAEIYPESDPRLVFPWVGIGRSVEELEGCAAALSWYRRAIEIGGDSLGPDHLQVKRAEERLKSCID